MMSDDYSRELLRSGIIEAKAGNWDSARRYLDRAIYMSSDHDAMAEAWYWMSQITDDPAEKHKDLENCLSNNLQHARARRALAILDGKIKPDEIVDPDHLPAAPEGLQQADAQRFVCPKCGGRMTFAPDGQTLVCEYCNRNQTLAAVGSAHEKDFIVAMATARGHDHPLAEQVVHCQGCGAEFILPPGQLSAECAYCGSPHVVNLEKSKDLLAPDGILPDEIVAKRALQILIQWVEGHKIQPEKKVDPPRGLYLPLWTFDLGGCIDYTAQRVENNDGMVVMNQQPQMIHVSDSYPVMVDDLPIPASRKPSAPFVRLIPTFDLKAVKPYDPRYLADWTAELYDVPMADASLDARQQAFAQIKRELPARLYPLQLTSASSAKMTVESFRLNLLPVWMTEVWSGGRSHLVLINGQTGAVESSLAVKPNKSGGLMEWLSDLVKE